MPAKKIIVIGAGFSGLAAASCLAKQGHEVIILEKNASPGGRARQMKTEAGYTFDMGPSWYWMPDVFEQYFALFDKKVSDYYQLERLDPGYKIVFGPQDEMPVPADMAALRQMFEHYEKGSSIKLDQFLKEAAYKYEVGMKEFVFKPSHSIFEFADLRIARAALRLQMFTSMSKYVDKLFKNPKLRELLKFPVLFLGATPEDTPAMYSLMNYADLALGTWYPKGGMFQIVKAMVSLAEELGVKLHYNQTVSRIEVKQGQAKSVQTLEGQTWTADAVVAGADYHHIEQQVLEPAHRMYDAAYWDKRTMAPSSLLYYVGVNKRLKNLLHHNLFFDQDFALHAKEIYKQPQWPSKPLFYACLTTQTEPNIGAPQGHENLFLLIPTAPGLNKDDQSLRDRYYNLVMDRLENLTGQEIRSHVDYCRSYAHSDFQQDYNAFKGNAYGLANTLKQTAFFKPKMRSNKVANLFFTGQLTTPGPGVPPSLISGQVVAKELGQYLSRK